MTSPAIASRQAAARARWDALRDRLRTVTPEAIGRAALTVACIGLVVLVVRAAGTALMPFLIGGVVAYAVLPIANRLDRFMPRVVAAILAELFAVAMLVGIAVVVVPPLIASLVRLLERLPTPEEVEAGIIALQERIGVLPEPLRTIALDVAQEVTASFANLLDGFVSGIADLVTSQILGIGATLSFLFGLLVIPAWILTIVADEARIKRSVSRLIAPVIRADVVALVRLVDRAFAAFLRVRVLIALVTGGLVYGGLAVAERIGIQEFPYALAGAVLLGALQLIPEIGFLLGFVPILLVAVVSGPVAALTSLVVYLAATRVSGMTVGTRASRGVLDVHPGLLIPAIVVLSEFGVLWLLAAAPIVVIVRDVVRYLAGRLAEPPRPAGVLPGEGRRTRRVATPATPSAYRSATAGSVPSAYRTASSTPVPSAYRTTAERSSP